MYALAVSSAEQRYTKAPVSRCFLSYQNHHAVSRVGCLSLLIQLFCPALAQMKMERRADQRVLDSIGKAIAVQQIGLLPGGWHPASPARGPKRTGWTPVASNQ